MHHRVLWEVELAYGPVYFRTLEEAIAKRDEILAFRTSEIPSDFYERQASLLHLTVHVESYSDGRWLRDASLTKTQVWGVEYAD